MILSLAASARRRAGGYSKSIIVPDTRLDALSTAGLTDAGGLLVSGVSATSYLVINKVLGLTYPAWSRFPNDTYTGSGGLTWENRFDVSLGGHGGPSSEYWTSRYATSADAESAAIAYPEVVFTGYTSYVIWLNDNYVTDNRGGLSLQISVRS
jgi:hypothetical protein